MNQLLFFFRMSPVTFILLLPPLCPAQTDSLVDCFPLSIGNQWTYHYDLRVPTGDFGIRIDTGVTMYSILGKTDFPDSVLWKFREQRNLRCISYFTGIIIADSAIIDSTFFDFVEIRSGRHELYRRGCDSIPLYYVSGPLWNSVIPFLSNVPDTAKLYRYYRVDSSQKTSFTIKYEAFGVNYYITLKHNSGLQSLIVSSQLVWSEGPPHADHELLAQTITGVHDHPLIDLPSTISLAQNYPNPFNPSTRIEYDLPTEGHVNLTIYTILGDEVLHLVDRRMQPGHYTIQFDGSQLPGGVYLAQLSTKQSMVMKKMVLVR